VRPLQLFQEPEHQPFVWEGGLPAALLAHGFPGTPSEMRPLGASLHEAGWTVQGLLLPGFGPQIQTLSERRYAEWVTAVREALVALQGQHAPVLLVGYSLGAALALQVAAARPPSGLILLAPFLRMAENPVQRILWPILKRIFPRVRPFAKIDLSDPQVRASVIKFMPGVDLEDADVQQQIRAFTVPTSLLDQLRDAGRAAYRLAAQVDVPTLVVQGTQDEVARPRHTRRLLRRLPGPVRAHEVTGGHDLLKPDQLAWFQVERTVLDFASEIRSEAAG
jgi:carboxylesterase